MPVCLRILRMWRLTCIWQRRSRERITYLLSCLISITLLIRVRVQRLRISTKKRCLLCCRSMLRWNIWNRRMPNTSWFMVRMHLRLIWMKRQKVRCLRSWTKSSKMPKREQLFSLTISWERDSWRIRWCGKTSRRFLPEICKSSKAGLSALPVTLSGRLLLMMITSMFSIRQTVRKGHASAGWLPLLFLLLPVIISLLTWPWDTIMPAACQCLFQRISMVKMSVLPIGLMWLLVSAFLPSRQVVTVRLLLQVKCLCQLMQARRCM